VGTRKLVGFAEGRCIWFIGSASRARFRCARMGQSVGRAVLQSDWLLGPFFCDFLFLF
jgi:hypothetical protein